MSAMDKEDLKVIVFGLACALFGLLGGSTITSSYMERHQHQCELTELKNRVDQIIVLLEGESKKLDRVLDLAESTEREMKTAFGEAKPEPTRP